MSDIKPVFTEAQKMHQLAIDNAPWIKGYVDDALSLVKETAASGGFQCIYDSDTESIARIVKEELHKLGFQTGRDSYVYGSKFYIFW